MNPSTLNQPQVSWRHGWAGIHKVLKCILPALVCAGGLTTSAQTIITTTNFVVGRTVPDGSASGLASATNVSTPIVSVTEVKVNLKISGTYNGDLHCYL